MNCSWQTKEWDKSCCSRGSLKTWVQANQTPDVFNHLWVKSLGLKVLEDDIITKWQVQNKQSSTLRAGEWIVTHKQWRKNEVIHPRFFWLHTQRYASISMETKQILYSGWYPSLPIQDSFTSLDPPIKATKLFQKGNSCTGKKNLLLTIKHNFTAIKKKMFV